MRAPKGAAILSSSGRNLRAISWLCALRSCQREQIYLDVGLIGLAAQEVMPHQSVEVVGPRGAGIDLVVDDFRLLRRDSCPNACATRVVCSSGVPSGMSMIT